MSNIKDLAKLGQSIWYDYIRRSFLTKGELNALIKEGLRGETSNPSILEKAIAGSADYDKDIKKLVDSNKSIDEIYEALALEDISMAADEFRPLYDKTNGGDGFISLEVSPTLANDTKRTIREAKRYFTTLAKPNVMIKVPGTRAGLPAIIELIGSGININVTLVFGLEQYKAVAESYIKGLEILANQGPSVFRGRSVDKIASVASFFVSRVDTAVDRELEKVGNKKLQGKIAVANSKAAYDDYRKIFRGPRWRKLEKLGARPQRVLWASTSTKNPLYPDTLYVDELIGPNTVNTVPPVTYTNFKDHGKVATTLTKGVATARQQLKDLKRAGVDLDKVTSRLLKEGVDAFAKSFEDLMKSIEEKRAHIISERKSYSASLGNYQKLVDKGLEVMVKKNINHKIWSFDYLVWKKRPTEISNRLGWLHIPEVMLDALPGIKEVVDQVRKEKFTHVVLLGMGGSSLAPEVLRETFGKKKGYLELTVLDSIDPGAVLEVRRSHNLRKAIFISSTKSGETVETLSFTKYFYNEVLGEVGKKNVGKHFIAITDPGSGLERLAKDLNFRATFLNDPNIGGRYSALSMVGVVPAAFTGMDVNLLLERAVTMLHNNESCNCPIEGDNSGIWLGTIMGQLPNAGRDKVTLIASPPIAHFGSWVEQLIAESTGKDGTGILPVDGEELLSPKNYSKDRLFVYLRLDNDKTYDRKVKAIEEAGHPVVRLHLRDIYDIGGEFFRWEMAIAVAGMFLGINPFDQPNVEAAKILARKMVASYQQKGKLPELKSSLNYNGIQVFSDLKTSGFKQTLTKFLSLSKKGKNESRGRSYISLQAYIKPSSQADEALQRLRTKIQTMYRMATTVGYGTRFLHSTGQLHKGDAGNGLFIQFTSNMPEDVLIPDDPGKKKSTLSFGVLKMAAALGDRQALLNKKRKVIRFNLGDDIVGNLNEITETLA